MKRIKVSPAALADLIHIHREGVRLFGPTQADHYLSSLEAEFNLIAEFPQMHRARPELVRNARAVRHQSHVIIYSISDDMIEILRIRHGREDWQED